MKHLLTATAICLTSAASAQEPACLPASQLDAFMAENNMEMIGSPIVSTSLGEVDARLYVSHIDGEWILIVLPPNGTACAALWGWDFWDGEAM